MSVFAYSLSLPREFARSSAGSFLRSMRFASACWGIIVSSSYSGASHAGHRGELSYDKGTAAQRIAPANGGIAF